jgi:hypothetical protein
MSPPISPKIPSDDEFSLVTRRKEEEEEHDF